MMIIELILMIKMTRDHLLLMNMYIKFIFNKLKYNLQHGGNNKDDSENEDNIYKIQPREKKRLKKLILTQDFEDDKEKRTEISSTIIPKISEMDVEKVESEKQNNQNQLPNEAEDESDECYF